MNSDEARRAWDRSRRTVIVETDLLAGLLLAANSPAHHHRKHATWDDDGSPCRRCRGLDEARAIIGWPCRSCDECTEAHKDNRLTVHCPRCECICDCGYVVNSAGCLAASHAGGRP